MTSISKVSSQNSKKDQMEKLGESCEENVT